MLKNLSCLVMGQVLFSFLVLLSLVSSLECAGEAEAGFISLFNGKDLDGWVIQGMEKAGPKILADGVMQVGGWDYWAVITKKEFTNFILRLDVKLDPRGNSGILFHTPKNEVYKSCFEIQLIDDSAAKGETKQSGAICDLVPPLKSAMKPVGEWNRVEIQYLEPKLTVKINGEIVQNELDISKIEGIKHKLKKGGIAIQRNDYFKAAYYKNIRINDLAFTAPTPEKTIEPICLHPDNPHYFLFRNQPTVLITSGEHYGAVLNLDFDYLPYLDELKDTGLNLTRTFSGAYCERWGEFGIEKNTLAPAPNRFICPWARSTAPGYINGGNKFDLKQWDESYFKRLKDFIAEAGKRGIVVELVLYCPFYNPSLWTYSPMNANNNVNGVSIVSSTEVYSLKDSALTSIQDEMTKKLVQELKGFDNLYYEVCNEPYFGDVTEEWQNHIISTLVEAESVFPAKHLIAKNIANGSQEITNPNPNVAIFNFHYAYPPDAVTQNYQLNKVIGYDETGFNGSSDTKYRGDAWAFIMAGGGVYDNLDYSFTTDYEEGTAAQTAPGGGSPALRCQLRILKEFMESFDFIRFIPKPSVIIGLEGKGKPHGWALAKEGKAYAIYIQKGNETNIRLQIPAGAYRAEWVNTKTAKIDKAEKIDHAGGEMTLISPWYVDDIALRIKISDTPATQKQTVKDTYHGTEVADDYRWLEDWNDPEVKKWSDAQNAYARSILDKLPNADKIRAQVADILSAKTIRYGDLQYKNGKLFAMKFQPPKQQPFLEVMDAFDHPENARVLVDPNVINSKGTTAIDWYKPSPDGRLVAVSLSQGGSESGDVTIYDTATAKPVYEVIPRVNGGTAGGDLAWSPDSSGFYYTRYPRGNERPPEDMNFYQQLYFHALGTATENDRYEIGKEFPRIAEVKVDMDNASGRLLASIQKGDGGEFSHYLQSPQGRWQPISGFEDKIVQISFGTDDDLYLVSRKDAPRGQILRLNISDLNLTKTITVVPQGKEAIITYFAGDNSVIATASRLYVLYQLGGPSEIRVFDYQGKPLEAPKQLPLSSVDRLMNWSGEDILFFNTSYIDPPAYYHYSPQTGKTDKTALATQSTVTFDDATVSREFAVSKDGTQVPVNIILHYSS